MWRSVSLAAGDALLLVANRNVVLGGVLLTAVLLIVNGVHVLATGRMGYAKRPPTGKVLAFPSRLILGAFYLALGAAVAFLAWQIIASGRVGD